MRIQSFLRLRDRGYPILVAFFLAQTLLLVWFGVLRPERMVVKGVDPVCYYAYLRSLCFDRDLDFRNEYTRLQEGGLPVIEPTPTGKTANVFSIGPALFLSPFFLAGHLCAVVTNYQPRDGYSPPYMVACFLGLAAYGLAGIVVAYAAVRRLFPLRIALLAVLGGWLATSIAYYVYPVALMPHTISFFLVGAFLWVWLTVRERELSRKAWFGLGLLGGLMMLARWQDGIFLAIPLIDVWVRSARNGGRVGAPPAKLWLLIPGALLGFLPQLLAWQVIYGRPFLIPQGGGFLLWLRPKIHLLLFSRHNGLFSWTPITLLGLIGLVSLVRKPDSRSLGVALAAAVAGQIYLNSIVLDWYAGMGFGARRFVGSMPILMLGLGASLEWLTRRIRYYQAAAVVGLFILWNALFLVQYYVPLVPWDRPITWRELVLDKLQIVPAIRRHALQTAAVALVEKGETAQGIEYAREAAALGPHSPEAHIALAFALTRLGNRPGAERELRAAAAILGGTEYVHRRFSRMLNRAGLAPGISAHPP